jgi:hypothetical protein
MVWWFTHDGPGIHSGDLVIPLRVSAGGWSIWNTVSVETRRAGAETRACAGPVDENDKRGFFTNDTVAYAVDTFVSFEGRTGWLEWISSSQIRRAIHWPVGMGLCLSREEASCLPVLSKRSRYRSEAPLL